MDQKKTMHDIKLIRDFPEQFDHMLVMRGGTPKSDAILALDSELRKLQTEIQDLNMKRNDLARQIGQAKSKGENADFLFSKGEEIKQKIHNLEGRYNTIQNDLDALLSVQPNTLDPSVPEGKDEADNKEIRMMIMKK